MTTLEGKKAPSFKAGAVKEGVKIVTEAFAKAYKKSKGKLVVTAEVKGKAQEFSADKILVTVGRKPNGFQPKMK